MNTSRDIAVYDDGGIVDEITGIHVNALPIVTTLWVRICHQMRTK
jgi:hypothetical protein